MGFAKMETFYSSVKMALAINCYHGSHFGSPQGFVIITPLTINFGGYFKPQVGPSPTAAGGLSVRSL